MAFNEDGSINAAVEALLTPQQEQGESEIPEQESPEEETLLAEEGNQDDAELVEEEESQDDEASEEEEVGGSDEEDELSEELEEPTSEQSDEEFYTVKVDGEEFEVNLEELKKGYQLEKNYTKKTQALSEEKKELDALKSQLSSERDKYLQVNEQLAMKAQTELVKAKQELDAMDKDIDPVGYVQKQLEVQDIQQGLQQQVHDYQAALTQKQQVEQQQMQAYLVEQDAILQKELTGWNDPAESVAIKEGIMKFAKTQGYSDEELSGISSAKDIITLNKARMYDELMAKKSQVRQKRTPNKTTPKIKSAEKAGNNVKKARKVKAKKEQFKRSGSVKDAQSLMEDLMQRKPINKR